MIESVDALYRTLFSVKFTHKGYETPMDSFFSRAVQITTDDDTTTLFKDYKMGYRFSGSTLVCFMQCNPFAPPVPEPKIPSVKIDGDIKIRFLIKNDSEFFTKTYVAASGSQKAYQFSNKTNNTNGSQIFLSAPVETYNGANDYSSGSVVENAGILYGAKRPVKAAEGIALSNTGFWFESSPAHPVVSNADLLDAALVAPETPCFGVIDLYNSGTGGSSYNLFDSDEKLLNPAPAFQIAFLSTTEN